MKPSAKQYWLDSLEFIAKRPVVLLPFIIFAFFEGLALELLYFSSRYPISFIADPIINKFFGESFIHYPGNILLVPKLFYYAQVFLSVVLGTFLIAIAVNIFISVKSNLPLKPNALFKNAARRYPTYLMYGIIVTGLAIALQKVDLLFLTKFFLSTAVQYPNATRELAPLITPCFLFATGMIMQVFFVLVLPILVIEKKSFLKALGSSVCLGLRYFPLIFSVTLIPYLLYFPIPLLKNLSAKLVILTFPEISIIITIVGIIMAIFIDCFVVISVSYLLLDKEKVIKKMKPA